MTNFLYLHDLIVHVNLLKIDRYENCRRRPDIVTENCCRVGSNLDNCLHLNCTVFYTNTVTFSESVRDDMS